ncbi:MAG: HPr family phosphocarrier protein [Termitinemataceae bacterium]|nr:MAG: HPr family phosphocarrier protein [Termitinemataceae bacterium]
MQTVEYVIKDPIGIHARPAGELVSEAKKFKSAMTISKGDKSSDLLKMFGLLKLGVKQGDTVKIEITGDDEEQAAPAIKAFLEKNL